MDECQIAVIGSGAAGMMAAIVASKARDCVLISNGSLGRSNSAMAQGGLQLPFPTPQSRQIFFDDIMRSARTQLDAERIWNFVNHINATVDRLVSWGLKLDQNPNGDFIRKSAGGLSEPRIVSARDQIGAALIKVLLRRLKQCDLATLEHTSVLDIKPQSGYFIVTMKTKTGSDMRLKARTVICCTGGITYHEARRRSIQTTNPPNENHVLFENLCSLGLPTIHADYFQYQPFGLVTLDDESTGRCVPESVVNFPVRILDRFGCEIGDIRQDRLALTTCMFEKANEGRTVSMDEGHQGFWLTLADVDSAQLALVYPKLHNYLKSMNMLNQNVLVFPYLHYYLGGIKINTRCETAFPGLFLAGEITGGLHGRNRLMGNGITDSLVHGDIAGHSAIEFLSVCKH